MIQYKIYGGTPQFAHKWAKAFEARCPDYNLTGWKIKRYLQLGMQMDDIFFHDTEKPNAVIVYPVEDDGDAFYSGDGIKHIKLIAGHYDTHLIVAENESECYDAIGRVPDAELFMPSGHGTSETLSFGGKRNSKRNDWKSHEEHYLDIEDNELDRHLSKLHSDAVIFPFSCSNGYGGEDADNLANFMKSKAGGRKLFSSTIDLKLGEETRINQAYPFNVKIIQKETGMDCTYIP